MNWVHVHDYHKEIAAKFVDNCEINVHKFCEPVDTKLTQFVDGMKNEGASCELGTGAKDLWRVWGQSDTISSARMFLNLKLTLILLSPRERSE